MKHQEQMTKRACLFLVSVLALMTGSAYVRASNSDDIRSFGATGDGKTDDTDAVQTALDKGVDSLSFPAGTYLLGTITVPANTTIRFAPRAALRINLDRIKDGTVIRLNGDNVTVDGVTFDFHGADGREITTKGKLSSLISAKQIGFVRITRLRAVRTHNGKRPVWSHSGWQRDLNAVSLESCHDIEVDRCYVVNANNLVYTYLCDNVSVHENRAEWCEQLTRFNWGRGLRHYGNWSRNVVFQCCWWGGDPNDVHDWVPDNTSNIVSRDLRPGDDGYSEHTGGVYDVNVQNNYAEYGVTLAWGAKARNVVMDGNIARFMEDMAYDSEGDENVVISNNISVNSKVAGIGCYFWTDKVLITGNMLLVLDEGDDQYKGNFIRLHSGGKRGPDHFGAGKALISGNLFVSEVNGNRMIQIEACRDVDISGNKFVNGWIETHQWLTSRRITILNNTFEHNLPGNYPSIRLLSKDLKGIIRGNIFRRTRNESEPAPEHAAIYIATGDRNRRHVIEGNYMEGWTHAVSCKPEVWSGGPARYVIRNNSVSGAINLIGPQKGYKAHVADNIHVTTLEAIPATRIEP